MQCNKIFDDAILKDQLSNFHIYVAEPKKIYILCACCNDVLNYSHHSLLIIKVLFMNMLDTDMIRNLKFELTVYLSMYHLLVLLLTYYEVNVRVR